MPQWLEVASKEEKLLEGSFTREVPLDSKVLQEVFFPQKYLVTLVILSE